MSKFEGLVPELSKWNNGNGISLGDWITCIGRYDHFLGYLELVWPSFIVVDDAVFIESLWQKNRYESIVANCTSKAETQKYLNLIDLPNLFLDAEEEVTDEFLVYLANAIVQAWEAKLSTQFPERKFKVVLENFLSDPDDCELNIYFFEPEI